ncbi:MAG: lipocalin-like domain-containing protein [Mycolicibacterium sp.]|nr:lipocalin-like domain-containing protein [Mycolicibacterium sp.]
MSLRIFAIVLACVPALLSCSTAQPASNEVVGTWRMISAQTERDGRTAPAYGAQPSGMLSFSADMRFVEVLTDSSLPPFASEVRGEGTDRENRAAMAGSIGIFGTYTVDADGRFSGNRVEGATFPNWVGDVRTTDDLRFVVDGNRMTENFTRPDGTRITITFERAS